MDASPSPSNSGPSLKSALGLPGLILYGIILIQPTAPMPLFGAAAVKAQGHVVTAILIGMIAMLFTAISYGRMANVYPNAGSAYTYVSREIHPALGYFVGWGMIFDYVMNPIICVIWCSKAAMNFIPEIPFPAYAVFFAVLELYKRIEQLAPSIVKKKKGKVVCTNVDFYSGFVYQCMGIPVELFTPIFAMARVAGWAAHRIEEIVQGRIIRPSYFTSLKGRKNYIALAAR